LRALRQLGVTLIVSLAAACGGGGSRAVPPVSVAPGAPAFVGALDALANRQLASGLVPSLEIGVARRGQTVFLRAYGSRSLSPLLLADASTDYQIASLTKAFTAASILLLAQDGKLSVDDPLVRYIPEYPPANQITLREMLNMVSGIHAALYDTFTTLYGTIDHATIVQRLATLPLDFPPGTRFEYSNSNYWLLGIVIERVAKMSYPTFVASRILMPIALNRTAYLATWNDADTAGGYWHQGAASLPFQARPPWSSDYLFSMGGLVSDAGDLLRWDESLRAPGFLKPASLATMFTVPNVPGSRYAMGWYVDPDGTRWHVGASSGFNTAQALYADGYDVVVLGNTWDQYAGAFNPLSLLQTIHGTLPP
jgi:D-alanyl-D-alanine carboxypeptidase